MSIYSANKKKNKPEKSNDKAMSTESYAKISEEWIKNYGIDLNDYLRANNGKLANNGKSIKYTGKNNDDLSLHDYRMAVQAIETSQRLGLNPQEHRDYYEKTYGEGSFTKFQSRQNNPSDPRAQEMYGGANSSIYNSTASVAKATVPVPENMLSPDGTAVGAAMPKSDEAKTEIGGIKFSQSDIDAINRYQNADRSKDAVTTQDKKPATQTQSKNFDPAVKEEQIAINKMITDGLIDLPKLKEDGILGDKTTAARSSKKAYEQKRDAVANNDKEIGEHIKRANYLRYQSSNSESRSVNNAIYNSYKKYVKQGYPLLDDKEWERRKKENASKPKTATRKQISLNVNPNI